MAPQQKHSRAGQHDIVKQQYDEVQSDGRYEEGMARMALYHRHCQDRVGDVMSLELERRFDVVTAIHLLHYLESAAEIESALRRVHETLREGGQFVTMIANPEFDLDKHDPLDSRTKFGYYFSVAERGNGGLLRFHPGGFEKERELTVDSSQRSRRTLNPVVGYCDSTRNPRRTQATPRPNP